MPNPHLAQTQARAVVTDPGLFHAPPSVREIAWRVLHSARGTRVAPLGRFRPVGAVAADLATAQAARRAARDV